MDQTNLAKALIINLDTGDQIECLFNPNAYTYHKVNEWVQGAGGGRNMPQLEFSRGGPARLQMQLFFDTYEKGTDVRSTHTEAIWNLMLVDDSLKDSKTQRARPPKVRFQWGQSWTFDAVVLEITQRFTMFLGDGTPVRATLDVTFQQSKDPTDQPAQNPTSGGPGGERVWTVNAGDTLGWIAFKEYGDATRWRSIAEANRLTSVRRLTPGTMLLIPDA
ncbi:MAG: LysM peptidoglycan-binding domain-containing protein [Candidatus Viridilinea halotolerans]|uniref:LysM peptidoglycan-binding domain-containing protein n=1 Tax=Candidatus Viridilinea halotolerans TaxID=2491704 RepID=A0A426U9B7_9CHLR|nr:MAG: LysM peptidoglycan-binding domain-containing protein [Candidatus Viridilinea halotolerans]